eukprot:scaffold16173_cov21-Tisochrysis_lutea.AAC.1
MGPRLVLGVKLGYTQQNESAPRNYQVCRRLSTEPCSHALACPPGTYYVERASERAGSSMWAAALEKENALVGPQEESAEFSGPKHLHHFCM